MATERRVCELRQTGERQIEGVALRYGDVADLGWTKERIEAGAFGELGDVILNFQHRRDRPLARTGGGGLTLSDSREALTIRAELPHTRDGDDALELVKKKILRGLSVEFHAKRERNSDGVRVIEKADLRGVGIVDQGAYQASVLREEVRVEGNGLYGAFYYNTDRVISDRQVTGRVPRSVRKRRFVPTAFDYALNALDRDVNLIIGKNWEHPLAFRMGRTPYESSLLIENEIDALRFSVSDLPASTWAADLKASIAGSAAAYGVDVIGHVPPADVVPNAVEIIPEPGNEEVGIEVVHEFVLTAISIVSRPPRGNPGEVNIRSGSPAAHEKRRSQFWL